MISKMDGEQIEIPDAKTVNPLATGTAYGYAL